MPATANTYATPSLDVPSSGSRAQRIRLENIKHETSVRSIGALYYLSGGLLSLGALISVAGLFAKQESVLLLAAVGFGALGALFILTGRGILRLESWARKVSIVLSTIGLMGVPTGTLINGYILYLLLSKKGKRLFDLDYRDIVDATPDVRHSTSARTWMIIGILIALFFVGIVILAMLH